MRNPKVRSAIVAGVTTALAFLFLNPTPGVALPPPPPNPSDEQIDGAASAKQQAEQAVSAASAAVTEMNGQIEALNAQAFAAATDYEQAQGLVEVAKANQAQTQQDLATAGTNVTSAEEGVKELARQVYMQGSFTVSDAMLVSADGPQDLIDRSNMLEIVSQAQYQKLDDLRVAKVQQANADSAAKQAVNETTAAEADAKNKLDEMNAKVASAQQAMAGLQAQKQQLDAQLAAAQDALFQLEGQKQTYQQWLAQKQAEEAAAAQAAAAAAAQQAAEAEAAAQAAAKAAAQAAADKAAQEAAAKAAKEGQNKAQQQAAAEQAAQQAAAQQAAAPPPPPSNSGGGGGNSGGGGGGGTQVSGEWAKPAGGTVTSCYCARWGTFHNGLDIANVMLTPIYAAGNGTVVRSGPANGFGQAIYIQHAGGIVTVYGHMEALYVSAGQQVYAGQKIAGMGTRGQSTGVHLHFEVTKGMYGPRQDPQAFLAARGIYY
ncbi:peptidoglycan DD-metalloendopeptidase family protein [Epidermidibacterium keratini]|uniref:Peptidoglycan DD-metalloendopeptidase family protein n=1 Tax=Epidermidibacterium keratini TaxID=1891644 RepID=A0A7L4YQJ2_9ACTN|nr:M23 family metallopeptidase [Epidermidibacterium keratini]QHC01174.1 peptidoglycan DD-metalloendopeptidase family protein [Epidermidibacterium keratini]